VLIGLLCLRIAFVLIEFNRLVDWQDPPGAGCPTLATPLSLWLGWAKFVRSTKEQISVSMIHCRAAILLSSRVSEFTFLSKSQLMNNTVRHVEYLFQNMLETCGSELRIRYPALKFQLWSYPVGSLTTYQGHSLGIECIFPRIRVDIFDHIALSIDVCHLDSVPRINADVVSSLACDCEISFAKGCFSSDEWPSISEESLSALQKEMPNMIGAFCSAVEQGSILAS